MLAISVIILGFGQVLMGVAIFALLKRLEILETRVDTHREIFERQLEINNNMLRTCAELNDKIEKINEKNS